ncbi:MAG: hypothetical protein LBP56_00270 [Odoribacteraceae bacterium]|jgi:hypothetical protein|nr:hypothetical protein [Odoribacteraceae bacterium]
MKKISDLLDKKPTAALCQEMVSCDILNKQAHLELSSYNSTGIFAHVHPLVIEHKEKTNLLTSLQELRAHDPEGFLQEVTNTTQNIRRIESNIRQKKYKDEATLISWQKNLEYAKFKQKILASLIRPADTTE